MITKGKAVKVRMGHKTLGNICSFETSNGMPGCNKADTTLHVKNYLDGSLVSRAPLPMGLHCQAPLRSGAEGPKELLAVSHWVSSLACCWVALLALRKQPTQPLNRCEKLSLSVVALSSRPVSCNP